MCTSLTSTANIRGAVITLSYSPCKPGNGLLQKQQQKSISGAPETTNPQKTTSYSTGLAQKKRIICSIRKNTERIKESLALKSSEYMNDGTCLT